MDIDLTIPDFLDRKKNPRPIVEVKLEAPKPRVVKLTPQEERDAEVRRLADRRWRNWTIGEIIDGRTTLHRPRLSTFHRVIRAELKAKGF